ncbi:hypothetical protein HG535_0B04720 [Zygotorulaspora mrakii]|uniref:Uncharacterized protein n=1 Tax=Zygotorulaspora mrakii TaxID=42260 RepID=A0A7H9AYF2_ZYGMR|nr:uncharacterized protein HG535_0B04720 [Zygotorulaspora mrakii]QLG71430.1 hypothetical protein HG535_0B04720 [Zygotorulaspora mrakii]
MKQSLLSRIQQGIHLPHNSVPRQHSPYAPTAKNLTVNAIIAYLYGYGAFAMYKDYSRTKSSAMRLPRNPEASLPSTFEGRKESVHDKPNRVFNSDEMKEAQISTPMRVLKSLTYGDISEISVAWGVLIQLCNTAHATYGVKSWIFRSSVLGVLGFPPLAYYWFRSTLFEKESAGVIIN